MAGSGPRYTYEIGTHLPGTPYRVEKQLGAGGMGVVYAVRHTFLNRREALKTIHPELVDRGDIAQRMKHEAEVLSSLRHPNIVQVTGGGVIEDRWQLPYFAMERLDGKPLREMIRRGALTNIESIYLIAYEMLDALAEAHAAGIVHRDVKPENIFLHNDATRTSGPRVSTKLLDFGVMAVLGGRQSRQFRGTFKYAAPEQLRGDPVSPQTDLYAAALVIYEMIAGRGPFDDISEWREVAKAHLDREPPPLSHFVNVPPSLDRLLLGALSKDPTKRPETAMAFAQQLYLLKQVADNGPLAPAAAATEETLLTAIAPTDDAAILVAGAGKTKPSPRHASPASDPDQELADKTIEQPIAALALGATLEAAAPPSGMTERALRPRIAFEKTGVDRDAVTRTLESHPPMVPGNGTDPIRSDEEFDPPGAPDSTRRYVDIEDEAQHSRWGLVRGGNESNVTPPPVSSGARARRGTADAFVAVPSSSVRSRRSRAALATVLVGAGSVVLAWGGMRLVRSSQQMTAAPASAVLPTAATAIESATLAASATATLQGTASAPAASVLIETPSAGPVRVSRPKPPPPRTPPRNDSFERTFADPPQASAPATARPADRAELNSGFQK